MGSRYLSKTALFGPKTVINDVTASSPLSLGPKSAQKAWKSETSSAASVRLRSAAGLEKCAKGLEKRVCVLVAREFELRDIFLQCINAFQPSKPFLKRSRARFLPGPPLITLRAMVIHQGFMNGQGWLRSRGRGVQAFFDRHFRPIHRLMPRVRSYRTLRHFACCQGLLRVDIQSEHPANSDSRCCESAMPQRYHFVTSTPKKTCWTCHGQHPRGPGQRRGD